MMIWIKRGKMMERKSLELDPLVMCVARRNRFEEAFEQS